jgi:hypothetical protein
LLQGLLKGLSTGAITLEETVPEPLRYSYNLSHRGSEEWGQASCAFAQCK